MLEYLGFLASIIVFISLLMSSVIKLRWINLVGSITFAVYGFLIHSLPVGILNIGTVIINIYYLYQLYKSKNTFDVVPFKSENELFSSFEKFYSKDILSYFPDYQKLQIKKDDVAFYLVKNGVMAGYFIASPIDSKTLEIKIDYVTPNNRDYLGGEYIYETKKEDFLSKGYDTLICKTSSKAHIRYLQKMGFSPLLSPFQRDIPEFVKKIA